MSHISRFLIAAAPLALAACIHHQADTGPHTIERGTQTAGRSGGCELNDYKTYRPAPRKGNIFNAEPRKAPYDAVIPPTYDAPSQLPSYCTDELGK